MKDWVGAAPAFCLSTCSAGQNAMLKAHLHWHWVAVRIILAPMLLCFNDSEVELQLDATPRLNRCS